MLARVACGQEKCSVKCSSQRAGGSFDFDMLQVRVSAGALHPAGLQFDVQPFALLHALLHLNLDTRPFDIAMATAVGHPL